MEDNKTRRFSIDYKYLKDLSMSKDEQEKLIEEIEKILDDMEENENVTKVYF